MSLKLVLLKPRQTCVCWLCDLRYWQNTPLCRCVGRDVNIFWTNMHNIASERINARLQITAKHIVAPERTETTSTDRDSDVCLSFFLSCFRDLRCDDFAIIISQIRFFSGHSAANFGAPGFFVRACKNKIPSSSISFRIRLR